MKYELKKLLGNRIVLASILVSLGIALYFAFSSYYDWSVLKDDSLKRYEGTYTDELYKEFEEQYEIKMARYELVKKNQPATFGMDINDKYKLAGLTKKEVAAMSQDEKDVIINEFYAINDIHAKFEVCRQALEYRNNVVKNAGRLKDSNDTYISKVNEKIYELYSKDINLEVQSENISYNLLNSWENIEYADYVNMIVIIIIICGMFLIEHSRNTYGMIYSSRGGRGKTYIRKMTVITIITTCLAGITTFIQIIPIMSNKDFSRVMFSDIQNIDYYKYSPYVIKIYQLVIIIALMRILSYLTMAMFITFITMFFKKVIVPFAAGTVILCGGYTMFSKLLMRLNMLILNGRTSENLEIRYDNLRKFTPFCFCRYAVSYLSEYEPNNIFDTPVSTVCIAVAVNLTYCVVFAVAGYLVYRFRFRKKGI